jgi:hypothetical protein
MLFVVEFDGQEVTGDQIMAMCQDEGPKEESGFLVSTSLFLKSGCKSLTVLE